MPRQPRQPTTCRALTRFLSAVHLAVIPWTAKWVVWVSSSETQRFNPEWRGRRRRLYPGFGGQLPLGCVSKLDGHRIFFWRRITSPFGIGVDNGNIGDEFLEQHDAVDIPPKPVRTPDELKLPKRLAHALRSIRQRNTHQFALLSNTPGFTRPPQRTLEHGSATNALVLRDDVSQISLPDSWRAVTLIVAVRSRCGSCTAIVARPGISSSWS